MSAVELPHGILLPFRLQDIRRPVHSPVVAVVGGVVDSAVINLALALPQEGRDRIDLLVLVEIPGALPMRAYMALAAAQEAETALAAAEVHCGARCGESGILLCRGIGPALVAEARSRGSTDLVLGAPAGGWWRRARARRAIAHMQAHARCRVYVVHQPPAGALHSSRRTAW